MKAIDFKQKSCLHNKVTDHTIDPTKFNAVCVTRNWL